MIKAKPERQSERESERGEQRKCLASQAGKREKTKTHRKGRQPRKSIKSIFPTWESSSCPSSSSSSFIFTCRIVCPFVVRFNRRLPSTFIIYDAYNCSNLCVCVWRKALLVFALRLMSHAKPFLIRGHMGCGVWHAACGIAQKEAAQVAARNRFEVHP